MRSRAWKYILAGVAGLLLGFYISLPWGAVGDYAVATILNKAAGNRVYATVANHSVEGFFSKTLVMCGIRVDYPVASITLRELCVTPHLLSLLLSAQTVDLTLGRAELTFVTRQSLEWNSGTAKITKRGDVVAFEEIDIRGAFSVTGSLDFSTATGQLGAANLTVILPETMDRALQMLSGSGLLPLRKVKNGEWRIER